MSGDACPIPPAALCWVPGSTHERCIRGTCGSCPICIEYERRVNEIKRPIFEKEGPGYVEGGLSLV